MDVSEVDKTKFVKAGYLVTKPQKTPKVMKSKLLPKYLVTASSCINTYIPDAWTFEWWTPEAENRIKEAETLGIDKSLISQLLKWVDEKFQRGDIFWPGVCRDLETAREICRAILPQDNEIIIISPALHQEYLLEFLTEVESDNGFFKCLNKRETLQAEDEILGFEPLGEDIGFHTWHCHSLVDEVWKKFGIKPNEYGLIPTYEEAKEVTEWLRLDETGAEPALWQPWSIANFPIS